MEVFPNNVNDFFRQGNVFNTSVNASGGGDNVSYNISAGYLDEQGYIPNNGLKKLMGFRGDAGPKFGTGVEVGHCLNKETGDQ